MQPIPNHITQQVSVQEALQQQANLGWKQLVLYRQITRAWMTLLNTKAPQIKSNNFSSKIIQHGWIFFSQSSNYKTLTYICPMITSLSAPNYTQLSKTFSTWYTLTQH